LVILGATIGANNLFVALALGALGQAPRRWRIAGVFGVFEFAVPLIGLLIGQGVSGELAEAGRWIGAAMLVALGLLTLRPDGADDERLAARVTTTGGLVGLAVSFTLVGLQLGAVGRRHWERRVRVFAGVALVAIGLAVGAGWIG
jgi:putative Mn2+ efflux pump MntP